MHSWKKSVKIRKKLKYVFQSSWKSMKVSNLPDRQVIVSEFGQVAPNVSGTCQRPSMVLSVNTLQRIKIDIIQTPFEQSERMQTMYELIACANLKWIQRSHHPETECDRLFSPNSHFRSAASFSLPQTGLYKIQLLPLQTKIEHHVPVAVKIKIFSCLL